MKKLFISLLFLPAILFAQDKLYFASNPTLTPEGKFIIFTYEEDLWKVPSEGGNAFRISAMEGVESNPRVSPDGNWIAFTGRQSGNSDVYLMPINGGKIKQLTFNDAADDVSSWSWDSKEIYFTSGRYNRMTTFKVSIEGKTPVRLFSNYFNWIHNFVINPKSGEYIFNESWESSIFANRKRYKGDFNPDIKSYNPKTKEFKLLTTYNGKDFWPTVDENGDIYFVSDEANDEYNLYTFESGNKKQLTSFNTSIKEPQVSANGKFVVFQKDYQIYLYDTAVKKAELVKINLPENNTLAKQQSFNVKGKITAFDVSPDEKKIAFVSRGGLFVSDIEGKFVKQINTAPEGRVTEVFWIDSLNLLYNETVSGWLNLFTVKADGAGQEKQLTFDERNDKQISLNNKKTKAAYISGRDKLMLIDLKTQKSEPIVTDEFWALESSVPHFSPDDNNIVYNAHRDFEQDIFIYNIDSKKSINITNTGVTETEPFWSPDGKYIYFASDRYKPSYPYGFEAAKLYRISLENFDKEFKSDRFDDIFSKDKKEDSALVKINYEDIRDRWEELTNAKGNQLSPYVINDHDETTVLYISNQDGDDYLLYKASIKPFDKIVYKKFEDLKSDGLRISKGGKKYFILADGNINELDLKGAAAKKIEINYNFSRNLKDEFNQMFYETWTNLDENYYDENFHGVNWEKIRDEYARFLPYLNSRADLRQLLNDMLGELNSSHQGFRSSGEEEKTFYKFSTLEPGIIFYDNKPFIVKHVVKNSPADKFGKDIKEGDELVSVNGKKIDKNKNREEYFLSPSREEEVILTFARSGKNYQVKLHPETTGQLNNQLYDEWIESNRKYVEEKSDNKIAYVYMKNMSGGSLNDFLLEMTSRARNKEGLILDLRYNTGGNMHDEVLQFLSQRPYLKWKYREGKFTLQPNFYPSAHPIVLLVNEQTLSDAEMTSTGFKALGLGKIIGTETYRWIIFTSGNSLVDGSFYRLPSWGCYTLDGKDIEKNGVEPDIYVKTNFKDRVEGKDPQLDKAIETVKAEMK